MIAQVKIINDKYDAIRKINGEDFNIFSILNLENNENKHSYFIYNLLDINGSHNQGDIFLKLFLEQILKYKDYGEIKGSGVKREDLTIENRRIDFTIETSKFLIGIEMKIDAGDQYKQLKDYHDELIKRAKNTQKIKLYYLNRHGTEASLKSVGNLRLNKDYETLSFYHDIYSWLEKCIEKSATIPTLREGLIQYRNLVQKLTNQTSDEKGEDMKTIITTQDDIEAANAITNEYPIIWAKKEIEFWNQLKEKIDTDWECNYLTDKNAQSDTIDFKIIADSRNKNNVYFGLEFSNFDFKCDIYSWSLDKYLVMDFSIKENADNILLSEPIYNTLKDIGFNKRTDDGLPWTSLQNHIQFYSKNVSEPSFELFDEKKFQILVNNTVKEVTKILQDITIKKEEILKAIKSKS